MEIIKEYITETSVKPFDNKVIEGISSIYSQIQISSWKSLEALPDKGGMFVIKNSGQINNEIQNQQTVYYSKNGNDNQVKAFASYKIKERDELIKEYSPDNIVYIYQSDYNNFIRQPLHQNILIQIEEIGVKEGHKGYGALVLKEMFSRLLNLGYQVAVTEIYNILAYKPVECPFYGYLEKNIVNKASQRFVTSIGAKQIGCYAKNLEINVKLDHLDYMVKVQRLLFVVNIEKALKNIQNKIYDLQKSNHLLCT